MVCGDIAPFRFNLGARRRRVVNLTLLPLYRRERTLVFIEVVAGWAADPV
jgi:hypothetical protein